MRSQVQVLAGPPPIPPGHSAVGRERGAPAASLGRAGAARPSPPASPSALAGPPTRAAGPTTTTHRGRPPSPDGSHAAAAAPSRWRLLPCPPCSRERRRSARWPGLPGRSAVTRRRPRPPGPGPPPILDDQRATRQHRPRQDPSATDRAARRRGSPPGPRPGPVVAVPTASTWSQRHRLGWEEIEASGRTGRTPDGLDTRWAGYRTGWTPDG
jgi:hypothetical protein